MTQPRAADRVEIVKMQKIKLGAIWKRQIAFAALEK